MKGLVRLVVVLLGMPSVASPAAEGTAEIVPPASQESLLPLHAVGVGFGLGVELTPEGWNGSASGTNGLLRLQIAWSPLDWLEVSFLMPGASVLLGKRLRDEVVLGAGIDGIGYGSVERFIVVLSVGAGYRHWFSGTTSLGVSGSWRGQYSQVSPVLELGGSVFFTHTLPGAGLVQRHARCCRLAIRRPRADTRLGAPGAPVSAAGPVSPLPRVVLGSRRTADPPPTSRDAGCTAVPGRLHRRLVRRSSDPILRLPGRRSASRSL